MSSRYLLSALAFVQLLGRSAHAAERVYVTNGSDDSVSVIDVASGTVTATIPLGEHGPIAIAVTPDGQRAYVTNLDSGSISVLDTATNSSIATIPVGGRPAAIAIASDGRAAYFAGNGLTLIDLASSTVRVVNAEVPTKLFVVNVFGQYISVVSSIALTPDGRVAYVSGGYDSVAVVDTSTGAVAASIPVTRPTGVAVTPDGEFAYLDSELGTVSIVETRHNTLVATVDIGLSALVATVDIGLPMYAATYGIATSLDGGRLYVAQGFPTAMPTIDTRRNEVVATVALPAQPTAIAVSRTGRAYVRNLGDTVSVIDTAKNSLEGQIQVGHEDLLTVTGIAVADAQSSSHDDGCSVAPRGSGPTWSAAGLVPWLLARRRRWML